MKLTSIRAVDDLDTANLTRVDSVFTPERCTFPESSFAVDGWMRKKSVMKSSSAHDMLLLKEEGDNIIVLLF